MVSPGDSRLEKELLPELGLALGKETVPWDFCRVCALSGETESRQVRKGQPHRLVSP